MEFAEFDFDPSKDLVLDNNGAWRWSTSRPDLEAFARNYFAGRLEDGDDEHFQAHT
jgi:hypothetical protein